jgi:GNAT superfamily N-acetyltransferase
VEEESRLVWSYIDNVLHLALENVLRFGESTYKRVYNVLHPPVHPALKPHPERQKGLSRIRNNESNKQFTDTPSYVLQGLAVHPRYQGCGVGSLLVNWGIEQAEKEGVPVFVGGEERGVRFYENACGFRRILETEWWLDLHGEDITRESVEEGNQAWRKENGGCSGCTLIYDPHIKR